MTRKHFEALAAALKESKPVAPQDCKEQGYWFTMQGGEDWSQYREALAQWRADVRAIAAVCIAHNPRFDTRFYEACGYEIPAMKP